MQRVNLVEAKQIATILNQRNCPQLHQWQGISKRESPSMAQKLKADIRMEIAKNQTTAVHFSVPEQNLGRAQQNTQ